MPSLMNILSQMTGLQKLSVARNLIVLPLLLLSFTLGSGVLGFTAPIVLPWVLYMGFSLGSNSHRLQAANGFHLASSPPKYLGLSTKVLYILSCVAGIVYIGVIAALLPDADNAPAPHALQVAVLGAVFFGVFLTLVGVRLGWASVEGGAPGTDPAKALRLVNPAGVKRQQLIYLAAGVFVLVGSLSSLSETYPRWAGDGGDTSASTIKEEQSLADTWFGSSTPSTDPQSAASAPQPSAGQNELAPRLAPMQNTALGTTANPQATQQAAQMDASQQAAVPASAGSMENETDYPPMTPCIQHWEDAYQAERDAQGLDSTVSIDQAWEWKHWCDAGRQAPTPQQAVKSDQWKRSSQH